MVCSLDNAKPEVTTTSEYLEYLDMNDNFKVYIYGPTSII